MKKHPNINQLPQTQNQRCENCWKELDPNAKPSSRTHARPSKTAPHRCQKCIQHAPNQLTELGSRATTIAHTLNQTPPDPTPEPPNLQHLLQYALCQHPDHKPLFDQAHDGKDIEKEYQTCIATCLKCNAYTECLKQANHYRDEYCVYAGIANHRTHVARNQLNELGWTASDLEPHTRTYAEQQLNQLVRSREHNYESPATTMWLIKGTHTRIELKTTTLKRLQEYLEHAPNNTIIILPKLDSHYVKHRNYWYDANTGEHQTTAETIVEIRGKIPVKILTAQDLEYRQWLHIIFDMRHTANEYANWENPMSEHN